MIFDVKSQNNIKAMGNVKKNKIKCKKREGGKICTTFLHAKATFGFTFTQFLRNDRINVYAIFSYLWL